MNQRVVLREFSSRSDAEIVRALLLANGIEASVISDDCGSIDPSLSFARGVQLFVAAADFARAEEVISEGLVSANDGAEEQSGQEGEDAV